MLCKPSESILYQLSAFAQFQSDDPQRVVVTEPAEFERLINFLQTRKVLVFDYETSGLEYYLGAESIGVAFGAWDDSGRLWNAYVPYRHRTGQAQLDFNRIAPAISGLLADHNTLKVCQNIKFEDHFTRREGWVLNGPRFDTMIAARLYNENYSAALEHRAAKDLGMGEAAYEGKRLLDAEIKRLARAQGLSKTAYLQGRGYSEVCIQLCGYYAGTDTMLTANLYQFYDKWGIQTYYPRIWPTEMYLTKVVCDMEEHGLLVDHAYLDNLRKMLTVERDRLEGLIRQQVGSKFNMASDEHVRSYMRDTLRLKLWRRTKNEALSVDHDVLEEFVCLYPVLDLILKWRDVEKLLSTYTTSILDKMDARGYVHGDLQQVGTTTGRLSCKEPNYHNFPGDDSERVEACGGVDPWSIKRAILVEPSYVNIYADYSQVELRVLAFYSADKIMMDAYQKGEDIHERTSQEVGAFLGKPLPRRVAKVVNFGLSYGMSYWGLARQAKISEDEAKEFLDTFMHRYPGIPRYKKALIELARSQQGQVCNLFGRTRRLPDLFSGDWRESSGAERQLIASMIQGTAAELTKESLVRLDQYFVSEGLPVKLINTVHDEIQASTLPEYLHIVAPATKALMENYPEFAPIPIIVDLETSTTAWNAKQEYQHE